MTRRCSHCNHNGHNSRTCPNRGVKLFGVRLTDGSIRKSASMGNLSHYAGSSTASGVGSSPADGGDLAGDAEEGGYASEDFVQGSSSSCLERKRGVPWTEEEHRMFLLGLQKLGKGDWRGISRNFVISRTPTQVASHAQKYFIRQTNLNRRKRRSSLFDIVADEPADQEFILTNDQELEAHSNNNPLPAPPTVDEECESMDSNNSNNGKAADLKPEALQCTYPKQEAPQILYPVMYPAFFTLIFPPPLPPWPVYIAESTEKRAHEVVKPTPVHSKAPINVDELLGMSKLSIGESMVDSPSQLTQNLLEGSKRQSAFHANPPSSGSDIKSSTSPIQAI